MVECAPVRATQRTTAKPEMLPKEKETETSVSHVIQTIQKRIRNSKKRLRGIEEIKAKAEAGKELNADQVCGGPKKRGHFDFCRGEGGIVVVVVVVW